MFFSKRAFNVLSSSSRCPGERFRFGMVRHCNRWISMYAMAYVSKEVADAGVIGRGASAPDTDVSAISLARRASEQNERRLQRQPPTGITHCPAANETATG